MADEGARADAERDLIARAKERSPTAWTEIYDAHYRRLFRYCYARTSDEATATDLASRVFLEALEGIDRYTYRGRPLLAWLYRIARNLVSDHLRARSRESEALQKAGGALARHEPGPDVPVGRKLDLLAAMSDLTEDQQQVVSLRFYAELSTGEIAQVMGRSERAVYSLEVRALAALRSAFADEGTSAHAERSAPFRG